MTNDYLLPIMQFVGLNSVLTFNYYILWLYLLYLLHHLNSYWFLWRLMKMKCYFPKCISAQHMRWLPCTVSFCRKMLLKTCVTICIIIKSSLPYDKLGIFFIFIYLFFICVIMVIYGKQNTCFFLSLISFYGLWW